MVDAAKAKKQPESQSVAAPAAPEKSTGLSHKRGPRKTYSQKASEVSRKWYVLDASKASLGRLSTASASLLLGKGKPTFTPHIDGGDYVIIINADKMVVTGGKEGKKMYYHYSGYPSGLRTRRLEEVPAEEAITKAIRGMLPVNKLRTGRLARLKIYKGEEHSHHAQKPDVYEMRSK